MDENNEAFVIDSDEKAEWALRKIREAKEERDRLLSLAELEQARISKEVEGINNRYDADTGWLTAQLKNYFYTVEHKSTKTQEKYQLLSGSLVLKRGGVKYTRDDTALARWLQANQRDDLLKVTVTPDWAELKKHTAIMDGVVIYEDTGEVIDGVTVENAPDTFTVNI